MQISRYVITIVIFFVLSSCSLLEDTEKKILTISAEENEIEIKVEFYIIKKAFSQSNFVSRTQIINGSGKSLCVPSLYSIDNTFNYEFMNVIDNNGKARRQGNVNFASNDLWDNYIIIQPMTHRTIRYDNLTKFKVSDFPLTLNYNFVILDCSYFKTNVFPTFNQIIQSAESDFKNKVGVYNFELTNLVLKNEEK